MLSIFSLFIILPINGTGSQVSALLRQQEEVGIIQARSNFTYWLPPPGAVIEDDSNDQGKPTLTKVGLAG